ncbi:iron chaperone [Microbacterium sp. NPDC056234]|uniref:iron chaperone n=1 Tax=Microbacterium sp. NPDC056234 TaxID=3345757 RepID=UPI0035E112E7
MSETKNFTDEEREAMKAAAAEKKTARSRAKKTPEQARAEGEAEVLAKIAELPEPDRTLATKLHELVSENAPHLVPRTYYGMPAWGKDGKVLCFFQPASKFKVRYGTFGFETNSNLDDGTVWPTSYAVTDLTDADLTFLAERIRLAAS